jgi:hypothetical protein
LTRAVKKISIVRDYDEPAGVTLQKLLQPFDRVNIKMVRRFVEQKHVRLRQQQARQAEAILLAA